jgi:hypothetical protein
MKMKNSKKWKIYRTVPLFLIIISILLSSIIAGCATAPFYPPVAFDVHQADATAVTEVNLIHDEIYELRLLLYRNSKTDYERVHKLAGSGRSRQVAPGQWVQIDDGVPIYVELKIVGLSEEVKGFSLEEKLYVKELMGGGLCPEPSPGKTAGCFLKKIKSIRLKPGLYRITLRSLRDIPELEGTRVAFWFGIPRDAKPFD